MDTFYSLNKLLAELNFSILGYYEQEKEIDKFFIELCDSEFISQKNHLEIISYSYAKLTELNSWDTKSLSSNFFFHSLNEKYSLLALNVYYSLRNNLFKRNDEELKESPHLSNNVAIVLSRLFLKDVGFRLSYTTNENWHFSFYEQNNLFSINLPINKVIKTSKTKDAITVFKNALSIFLSDSIKAIDNDEKIKELLIQKKKDSRSNYFKFEMYDINKSPIEKPFNNFLNIFRPKKELEELRNEMIEAIFFWHKTNPGYFTDIDVDTKKHIENWVELFFQIFFISLVYDSWVEYFPSVCGVQEKDGDKLYRNLGGLIVGYKIEKAITIEERSIFRIISSRISSVVSGQWMFDFNEETKLNYSRKAFKNLFDDFSKILDQDNDNLTSKKNRSHAVDNVDSKVLETWSAKVKEYLEPVKPYITTNSKYLTEGNKTHQGLLINVYPEKSNRTFLQGNSKFYKFIDQSNFNNLKFDYIDFLLLEKFVCELHKNKAGIETGNVISIESKQKEKRIEVSVNFLGDKQYLFGIEKFYAGLKSAHTSTGNSFSKFILSNYNLFRIHGDLEILANDNSLFLLSRDVKLNMKNPNNIHLEVVKENIPDEYYDHLKFIIYIQHELKHQKPAK